MRWGQGAPAAFVFLFPFVSVPRPALLGARAFGQRTAWGYTGRRALVGVGTDQALELVYKDAKGPLNPSWP